MGNGLGWQCIASPQPDTPVRQVNGYTIDILKTAY